MPVVTRGMESRGCVEPVEPVEPVGRAEPRVRTNPSPEGTIGDIVVERPHSSRGSVKSCGSSSSRATRAAALNARLDGLRRLRQIQDEAMATEADMLEAQRMLEEVEGEEDDRESVVSAKQADRCREIEDDMRGLTFEPEPRTEYGTQMSHHSQSSESFDWKVFLARQGAEKELPSFGGDPEDWPCFREALRRSTAVCKFTDGENLSRLQKALKGKAKEAVHSMLVCGSPLEEILDILELNFGRPQVIIKSIIAKVEAVKPIPEGGFNRIVEFSTVVRNLCSNAVMMGLPQYLSNPQLLDGLIAKLPTHMQYEWGSFMSQRGVRFPDLKLFSSWLTDVAWRVSMLNDTSPIEVTVKGKMESTRAKPAFTVKKSDCILGCNEGHGLWDCAAFKSLSVKERWEQVKGQPGLCFNCLGHGHAARDCQRRKCGKQGCQRPHHTLLHQEQKREAYPVAITRPEVESERNVIMSIIPVILRGPDKEMQVNAFLDEGSYLTLLDEDVSRDLGLEGPDSSISMQWINDGAKTCKTRIVSLGIARTKESEVFSMDKVRTVKNLKLPFPSVDFPKVWRTWPHLKDVPPYKLFNQRASILLGKDQIDLILARANVEINGNVNAPKASLTKLGWVIHGRNEKLRRRNQPAVCTVLPSEDDNHLHALVKAQFSLDALGIVGGPEMPRSRDDKRALQIMEQSSVLVDNRWETALPWKDNSRIMPTDASRKAALKRLQYMEKKMDADPCFADLYCRKIQEYVDKGFCRKLSEEELLEQEAMWYLPHFGTTNPNKPGKFRLVFDCAAKASGISLNDALLQGPDLMSPLISVLFKFRQYGIGFCGDIRDMFHMVLMRSEDQVALRFLWRGKDRSHPPEEWTMNVMVFGAVSSPFQAQWIKNHNAVRFVDEFPSAVDGVLNRHYVDDYLDSCPDAEQAIKKIMDVREVHRRGGFEIRNWTCNDSDVLRVIAPGSVGADCLPVGKEEKSERVLGLNWLTMADVFTYVVRFRTVDTRVISGEKIPTKRELLRLVMCLFDPLGFIGHILIQCKMLIQDAWRLGLGWDDELPSSLLGAWSKVISLLKRVDTVKIPRCYSTGIPNAEDIQLHVFCDASERGYCAVAYIRVIGRGSTNPCTNIIMSKTRVAPLQPVSIPRLELQAALIGSRVAKYIVENHTIQFNSVVMWSDSKTVLCWIRAEDPRRFRPYVANRIGEIAENTNSGDWRWVPTLQNVADEGTKDTIETDISPECRWFRGPDFLVKEEAFWPTEECVKWEVSQEDLELKKATVLVLSLRGANGLPDIVRFSSWSRLVRVTAWTFRFVRNTIKKKRNDELISGPLSVEEIEEAVNVWVKQAQVDSFGDEIDRVRRGLSVKKSSPLWKLNAELKDGVLVARGRLEKSNLPAETRMPIVLDGKHKWTKLLVDKIHKECGHHGIEFICNEIRQQFHVIGLRVLVKRVRSECMQCQIAHGKVNPPQMAPLPAFRVNQPPRPFTYVGIDYFGPFEVNVLRSKAKRYGVLFTCLSTRAVHLEVAWSLSTDAMIMALDRFISRRGEPKEIWSDNGTNLRGADRELKTLWNHNQIIDKLTMRSMKWNFIPPGAPHMGGAWERLVRSVKNSLIIILKDRPMNDELLLTVMSQAEISVNSRPLTCVSDDVDDEESITPNCFLMGTTGVKQPPGTFSDADLSLKKRWRMAQVLGDHFWKRWVRDYLPTLGQRQKWQKKVDPMKVGEIVFIPDLNVVRNKWRKGVIERTTISSDGQVRVVDVRTGSGVIRRPVAKILRLALEE